MTRHVRSAQAWLTGRLAGRTKVQASIYYASSSITCQILRFAALILGMRLINADQFGFFGKATLALSYTGFLREIGQNNALVSYSGSDHRFTVFNFQINLVLGTLAATVLLLVLKFFPGIPLPLRQAAFLLAAITFCEAMIYTGAVLAQRGFRFRLIAVADISAVSLYLLTIVVLVHRLEGFLVLVYAQLIEGFTRLLILSCGDRWRFVGWINGKDLRDYYFRKYLPVWVPQNLLLTTSGRIDYLLLSGFANDYELGVYDRLLQFVRIPWSLSINLLDRVLMASYSKEQNSPAALRATLHKARWLTFVAALAAVGATTLGIVFVLDKLIGTSWTMAIRKEWWLAIPYSVLVPLIWNHNILLQGTGNPKYLLIVTTGIMLGELILGGLALAGGYGVGGLFIARALVQASIYTMQCGFIRRLYGKDQDTTGSGLQRTNSNIPQA